jgi:hypothetical protein
MQRLQKRHEKLQQQRESERSADAAGCSSPSSPPTLSPGPSPAPPEGVKVDARPPSDAAAASEPQPASPGSTERGASTPAAVTSKGHVGYYYFDSSGRRLPNKWCVCACVRAYVYASVWECESLRP